MPPEHIPFDAIRLGITLLLEAFDCAQDAGCDAWDFAVELAVLSHAGLTRTHLRWLASKGYIRHGVEYIPRGEDKRLFRHTGPLTFGKTSCFVLTPEGREFAIALLSGPPTPTDPPPEPPDAASPPAAPASPPRSEEGHNGAPLLYAPRWNGDQRSLFLGASVVKHFTSPAPNQELILASFQEEKWPERIDDPLPPVPGINSKRRLHDTIYALNHNQRLPRIHFMTDNLGNGIHWEIVAGPQLYVGDHDGEMPKNSVNPSASDAVS